ncbi:hypothetical protein H2200_006189 [Cladophialophora chaetospira]|uniref:Transcription factor domain-containing protein n=1 Tax=Cladophialophora chaetospira TaxID=386627 RepID=A0AA38XAN4_9EURO|nr:hypothetical protein H2200_006189 [Cladophialophora chaetospira]
MRRLSRGSNVGIANGASNVQTMSNVMNEGTPKRRPINVLVVRLIRDSTDLLTRHQKSAHNIEPLKRRRLRQDQPDNAQHDAVNWQAQSHDRNQHDGNYSHQLFGVDANPTLALNMPPPLLAESSHHSVNESQQGRTNGMLAPSLNDSAAFQYMSNHVHANAAPSMYSSQEGVPMAEANVPSIATGATALTSMSMPAQAGTNFRPHNQQTLEQHSVLPQLNSANLEVASIFDNVDFLVDNLNFPSPMTMVHPQSETVPRPAPAPPVPAKSVSTKQLPQPASPDEDRTGVHNAENQDINVFSRIGSPLPSLRTLGLEFGHRQNGKVDELGSGPCWKVSQADYLELQASVARHTDVLPSHLVLPSRHTMSAYLERCINSLYKHQPFFHVPTFRVGETPLELVLAMCATGAQLRFESQTGVPLFHASKALIMSRLQDRHEETILNSLKLPHRPRSINKPIGSLRSPEVASRRPSEGDPQPKLGSNQDQPRMGDLPSPSRQRLQTMQTILTLMSFGSWGLKGLLGETIVLQSMLVMLVREEGLDQESDTILDRYDTVQARWESPQRWDELRVASRITAVPFQAAFRDLFQRETEGMATVPDDSASISALGNYALIFGLLQCIYFLRLSHPVPYLGGTDTDAGSNLRRDDIEGIIRALHRWQRLWEKCPESTIEPEASAGPISFNAIACLRLAWIRLYVDMGPCRNLATRDPNSIIRVFTSGPALPRSPRLAPVLLQAIHALSVPVRLGIKFVARSQSLFWSMNQSLCALECAAIINNWFVTLSATVAQTPMSKQEKNLVLMIRGMVLESGFFTEEDLAELSPAAEARDSTDSSPAIENGLTSTSLANGYENVPDMDGDDFGVDPRIFGMDLDQWLLQETAMPTPPTPEDDATAWQHQIGSLRVAVARLWAEIFSINHVFDLVTTIGKTLNAHLKILEPS